MKMKRKLLLLLAGLAVLGCGTALAAEADGHPDNFYKSDKVTMQNVDFNNQYKMKVAGHLFTPKVKNANNGAAVIVGHPMGAVKEQSADLYATKLAEQGFTTLSIDFSFWGGSGSFAISAAKIDPRIKAVATVSMYDMGDANRNGLHNSTTLTMRKQAMEEAAEQRYVEFTGGETKYTSGTVHELNENSTPVEREFYEYYRTPRGEFTPEGSSPLLTTHPTLTSNVKFLNFYPFNDIETISPRPLLFITGSEAHSREFSEKAYARAAEPKELYIVPGAGHVDLYDKTDLIPFGKLTDFFAGALK